MAKKKQEMKNTTLERKEHIAALVKRMSEGVFEKEQIIAMSLLSAVAGENIFLLGPPGTAKSMVASRLKDVFMDGKSFDYLMSRFSTPDEIFGPVSISKLKNEDRYERLTAGFLPDADIVFLDEIWKAGPSIQNTLLTVINEHIYHNGGRIEKTPMKVLIAASNELPAKDEGLEALWDRFLVRMVSNCIESDSSFFKMLQSKTEKPKSIEEELLITDELYEKWQEESKSVGLSDDVKEAIKSLRKKMADMEKEDGGELRYYISDRRWRKAFRLMQTSAYLNGREVTNLTDFLLLIHCFWNDAECIPKSIEAVTNAIADSTKRALNRVDKQVKQLMRPSQDQRQPQMNINQFQTDDFAEFEYFYYLVENFPDGETYMSKWDYSSLDGRPREGVKYYDSKRKKVMIHVLMPGTPFDATSQNASSVRKVRIQRTQGGVIIDGVRYGFMHNPQPSGMVPTEITEEVENEKNLFMRGLRKCRNCLKTRKKPGERAWRRTGHQPVIYFCRTGIWR